MAAAGNANEWVARPVNNPVHLRPMSGPVCCAFTKREKVARSGPPYAVACCVHGGGGRVKR